MKLKIFNTAVVVVAVCFATSFTSLAQSPVKAVAPADSAVVAPVVTTDVAGEPVIVSTDININLVKVKLRKLKKLSVQANAQVMAAVKNINMEVDADDIAPQVNVIVSNAVNHSVTKTIYDDADLVKNYSKTYPADANDVLSIENKYGNVTVNTWNRNEIKVDVQIKVSAGDDDATKRLLDNVNVSDSKNGSSIAFRTIIGDTKGSWYSNIFNGNSSKRMEINYTVYMPAKNDLVIDSRYGAVVLPNLSGRVTINCAYGSLNAKTLSNESTLRVRYSNANIDNLDKCTIQLSYGELTVGNVNELTADVSYSPVKISKLTSAGTINLRYGGGLRIGDLGRNVKSLVISSSYSNIDIGLSGDENADFAIATHYGDFDYGDHAFTVTNKSSDDERSYHATKTYKGYIGKPNSGRNITVSTNYGNVKFE